MSTLINTFLLPLALLVSAFGIRFAVNTLRRRKRLPKARAVAGVEKPKPRRLTFDVSIPQNPPPLQPPPGVIHFPAEPAPPLRPPPGDEGEAARERWLQSNLNAPTEHVGAKKCGHASDWLKNRRERHVTERP